MTVEELIKVLQTYKPELEARIVITYNHAALMLGSLERPIVVHIPEHDERKRAK
jgi:hypothetical protein